MANPKPFLFFIINQYNDRNIRCQVFYDCIVIFYVHLNLDYHTFIFKKESSFDTLCYLYSHYRYHHTCDVIPPPNAPSQEVGHWNAIILHTARVFIDPTPGVPFKISILSMSLMVRAAIIEYAPCVRRRTQRRLSTWCRTRETLRVITLMSSNISCRKQLMLEDMRDIGHTALYLYTGLCARNVDLMYNIYIHIVSIFLAYIYVYTYIQICICMCI